LIIGVRVVFLIPIFKVNVFTRIIGVRVVFLLSVAIRLHASKDLVVANMTPEERVFIARAFGHDSLISTLEADIPGTTGVAVGLLGSEIRKDYIFTQWKDISQVGIGATKMFVERVLVGMGVSNNAVNLYGAIDNTIGASDQ
jgi:hypothetical protein